jgi:RNA polymerase sigma factor (sigma-70 family)
MNETRGTLTAERLEALYASLEKPMFNVVYRWLWDRNEARDVVQDAFVRVWQGRARVRLETIQPLLFRTAVNLAANRRRARRLRAWVGLGEAEDAASEGDPEGELGRRQREQKVRRAVEALPEKLRQVVLLCELSGLSNGEVAQVLRIPEGTVASRKHLAMRRLEEALHEEAA